MSMFQISIDAISNDANGSNDQHAVPGGKLVSQSPVTDLVKVNTTVAGAQFAPAVTALSGGGYVIVWEDSSAGRIFAQRFSAAGAKVGNELQLDSTQGGSALWVSVAATANDGFVIAFQAGSFNQAEIFARRYDSANNPVGGLFAANTTSPNEQFNPHVTALDNGSLLFTWDTRVTLGNDVVNQEVRGRIYDAGGQPLGNDFAIAPVTATDLHGLSAITTLPGGGFVVTWQRAANSSGNFEIVGQRFTSNGSTVGAQLQANTQTANNQYGNDVARLSDGGFVVSWVDPGNGNVGGRIVARHYDASGNAIGGEIVIDSKASGSYGRTTVTATANGTYVVSWTENDAADNNVLARQMAANDQPIGAAFEMSFNSPFAANYFSDGAITLANGNVVFAWDGPSITPPGGQGTGQDIYMRVYDFSIASNTPTEGDDVLTDTAGNDSINALGGNDRITVTNGRDTVAGGTGNDLLVLDYAAATSGVATYNGPSVNANGGFDGGISENSPQISQRLVAFTGIERFDITTGSGADDITTATGDDVVRTGAGDDRVNVGSGVNTADGGADVDAISADLSGLAAGATINLGNAVNTGSYGTYSNFEYFGTITGSNFDDVLVSTDVARIDTINAGAGNDAITVRNGRDLVDGGTGTDTLTLDWVTATQGLVVNIAPTANPNGGFDGNYSEGAAQIASRLVAYAGIERFVFRLGSANDTLTIATALDDADGGSGTDTLSGSFAGGPAVDIDLVSGTRFVNFEGFVTVTGSAFDDRFVTTSAQLNETLSLGDGNDSVTLVNGRDSVSGGLGTDTLIINYAAATGAVINDPAFTVNANGGFDGGFSEGVAQISQRFASFTGIERFIITTGSGNDTISTATGNDILDGGAGNDRLTGGAGNDTYIVDSSLDVVIEASNEGTDEIRTTLGSMTAGANIENLTYTGASNFIGRGNGLANVITGGVLGDQLFGKGGDDTLNGADGADVLDGGTGSNIVNGGNGDDLIYTGVGNDMIDGGAGRDTVVFYVANTVFTGSSSNVELFENLSGGNLTAGLNAGDNLFGGSIGIDTVDGGGGIDFLYGREGNDVLTGGDGSDRLFGMADDDSLSGGNDNDYLYGDVGNDALFGGVGNDVIYGENGVDTLTGGAGIDYLHGGSGADTFVFAAGDSGTIFGTADLIADFSSAQGDRIDLTAIDAVAGGGDNPFTFIGGAAFGNVAGELRYELIGGNTYVMGDTNGDSMADFVIRVDGAVVLTGADFLL